MYSGTYFKPREVVEGTLKAIQEEMTHLEQRISTMKQQLDSSENRMRDLVLLEEEYKNFLDMD